MGQLTTAAGSVFNRWSWKDKRRSSTRVFSAESGHSAREANASAVSGGRTGLVSRSIQTALLAPTAEEAAGERGKCCVPKNRVWESPRPFNSRDGWRIECALKNRLGWLKVNDCKNGFTSMFYPGQWPSYDARKEARAQTKVIVITQFPSTNSVSIYRDKVFQGLGKIPSL